MAAVSLSTLRTRARRRANQENSLLCSPAEVADYLNEGAKRLHELLVGALAEEYVKKAQAFATIGGTSDYALPSDFFKLTGVDLIISNKAVPLQRYNEPERNAYKNISTVSWFSVPRYKLEGSFLRLYPAPTTSLTGSIIYIPLLQVNSGAKNEMSLDADTVDFPNGWEKFVTLYAAIEMMDKEETETRHFKEKLAKWEAELIDAASNRDAAHAVTAVDHDLEQLDPRWW